MSTKTIVILGAVAVAAWLFISRRQAQPQHLNGAGGNSALIATGISAGAKILGSIFQTAGGSGGSRIGGAGGSSSGFVTSYDQISGSKAVGNGFVTSLDDA